MGIVNDIQLGEPSRADEQPAGVHTAGSEAQELDVALCWVYVRQASVGRLAVVIERRPDIFPVNHVVDHGTVVFRTGSGSKLASAEGQPVAFEVDGWDEDSGLTWSVVVRGRAERAREPYEVLHALGLPLTPWHPGAKPWFVRIEPDTITGRRFTRVR